MITYETNQDYGYVIKKLNGVAISFVRITGKTPSELKKEK